MGCARTRCTTRTGAALSGLSGGAFRASASLAVTRSDDSRTEAGRPALRDAAVNCATGARAANVIPRNIRFLRLITNSYRGSESDDRLQCRRPRRLRVRKRTEGLLIV